MNKNKEARNKRLRAKYLAEKHSCKECGKPTHTELCHSCACKRGWQLYPNRPKLQKGSKHPNWRGGRIENNGYILIYNPEHPKATKNGIYVLEHILVWEQSHGKPLPKGWIVHHLNGIKDDNRPQNLEALPNKKHYLVLQAKAKRIQELEALLNHQQLLL